MPEVPGEAGWVDLISNSLHELETFGVSWLTFQYIPPTGVSDDVTSAGVFFSIAENSGLHDSDYGTRL